MHCARTHRDTLTHTFIYTHTYACSHTLSLIATPDADVVMTFEEYEVVKGMYVWCACVRVCACACAVRVSLCVFVLLSLNFHPLSKYNVPSKLYIQIYTPYIHTSSMHKFKMNTSHDLIHTVTSLTHTLHTCNTRMYTLTPRTCTLTQPTPHTPHTPHTYTHRRRRRASANDIQRHSLRHHV